MKRIAASVAALLVALATPACAQSDPQLDTINLPPGFRIEVFARVPEARSMTVVAELGAVFVGNRRGDSVYVVIDANGDGRADTVKAVATDLRSPNGVAWKDGYLYIAEQHRVIRIPIADAAAPAREAEPEIVFTGLPDKRSHGWRYIAFDPGGRLHVTVGSPCNVCMPEGMEGTIIRVDGPDRHTVMARGLRNSVGIDFHPTTGVMYFTDNGADRMGDNIPPDELNRLTRPGQHFGYPHFGGGTARTREFGDGAAGDMVPPIVAFDAHVAALGVHFYRGRLFPGEYRTDAFVAQHGSWNRSEPIGYRVMRVRMDEQGNVQGTEVFAHGWLQGGSAWGRPVDVKELADGSLLVSDDASGTIYRISYAR